MVGIRSFHDDSEFRIIDRSKQDLRNPSPIFLIIGDENNGIQGNLWKILGILIDVIVIFSGVIFRINHQYNLLSLGDPFWCFCGAIKFFDEVGI